VIHPQKSPKECGTCRKRRKEFKDRAAEIRRRRLRHRPRNRERKLKTSWVRITDVRQSKAGYANYQQWIAGTQLEQRVSLEDYSVSNRGLRSGLVGTPEQVQETVAAFEAAGVDLLLLQFSPQLEEMEAFSKAIIIPKAGDAAVGAAR
jgi:alkanesulfonate monooxygenase SsuD/methylene tetrahydromethanopterin reductase-like flavin-dependent oxidoreductase (luciferase family)